MSTAEPTMRQLRRTSTRLAALLKERDRLIVQARTEKESWRGIADAAGMTHLGVKRLVERSGQSGVLRSTSGGPRLKLEPRRRRSSVHRP